MSILIKIEFVFDVSNQEHQAAVLQLFDSLGGVTPISKEPKTEPETEPKTEPETEPKTEPKKSKYAIEQVRVLVTEKASTTEGRILVKNKLTELGASNVSSLEVETFDELMDYLNSI